MKVQNTEMENVSKPMAKLFYEQCAGTYCGQMANLPNSPLLFGLIAAHGGKVDDKYASTQTEFAEFLRSCADALTS